MRRTLAILTAVLMLAQLTPTSNMFASEEVQTGGMYPLVIGDTLPARTFSKPTALHVTGTRLLVCDQGLSSIQNIINQNDYRFGIYGVNDGQIHTPGDITTISNKPYITDTQNNKVIVFSGSGKYESEFSVESKDGVSLLDRPIGITNLNGRVYIANSGAGNIIVTDENGAYAFTISGLEIGLTNPTGIDAFENSIYVTDPTHDVIGIFDYDGNFVKKLDISNPYAVMYDENNGNLLVTSPEENVAYVLDADGQILKTLGQDKNGKTVLSNPKGIDILSNRIIISSEGTDRIQVWNSDGSYYGDFNTEVSDKGSMARPERVYSNGDNIYIPDSSRRVVLVYKKSGQFVKEIGKEGEVSLVYPTGVCVGQNGDIFVVDKKDNNIKVYDSNGTHLKTIGGMGTTGGFFRDPTDICIDTISNRLYISDTKNHRIQVLSTDGEFIDYFGEWGTAPGQFIMPMGIDLGEDRILVTDFGNSRVQEISLTGKSMSVIGSRGRGRGQLLGVTDCSYDSDGKIYVADSYNHRLMIFDTETGYNWKYGTCGGPDDQFHMMPAICPPPEHDPLAPGFFKFPQGIFADAFGCFVADSFNSRIQYVDYTSIFKEYSFVLSPSILDFGVVPNGTISEQKVTIKNISGGEITGIIDIDSKANWLSVRNSSFSNDKEPIDFIVDTKGLENGVYETDVSITTNKDHDNQPTMIHVKVTVGEAYSYIIKTNPIVYRESNKKITIPLTVVPQNGFTSTVALSVENSPPKTYGQFSSSLLKLKSGDSAESILSIRSSDGITPGIYTITLKGETPKLKYETYTTFSLVVSASQETEPRTVLGETYTAEWCINCPYAHRAAERLVEEYGNTDIVWLNYYVETPKIDEAYLYYPPADKRYKWYPGQGLPTTFFDGMNSVVGGDNHEEKKDPPEDKQSCDKFSGTTYTYNRYKTELLNTVANPAPISIFTDTKIDGRTIKANIEIELKESLSNNKNLNLYVVLTEDNIEFPAMNTDEWHNLIVREMYTSPLGEEIELVEGKLFTRQMELEIPDYVNVKNAGLVVWVQNNGSKSVLQTTISKFHNQPVINSYEIIRVNDVVNLEVGGDTELQYRVTNTSSHILDLSCLPEFTADGWDYVIEIDGVETDIDDFMLNLSPFESKTISIKTAPPADAEPGIEASFDIITSTHKNDKKHNLVSITTIPRLPPDFTFEPDINRVEITKGQTKEFKITIDPINEFSGPVTLTDCTGNPSLKVEFNPSNGVPPFETNVTVTGGEKLQVDNYNLCLVAKGITSFGEEIEHQSLIQVDVQYAKVLIAASPLKIISCSENEACHSSNVDIMINSPMEIASIQFSVRYDPTILTVTHHEAGDFFVYSDSSFNFLDRSVEGKITVQISGDVAIGKGKLCTVVMRGIKGVTKKGTSIEVCDVVATDPNGNSVLSNIGCTHQEIDVISHLPPPLLTVEADDGAYVDQENYIIKGSAKSVDPDYPVSLSINGREIKLTGEGIWEYSARLREGPNTFVIIAKDETGTSSAKKIIINRDSTPPMIGISNFKDGQTVNEATIEIEGWVDEASETYVNGEQVELSEFNEFKKTIMLDSGENIITLEATDRMGRKTTVEFKLILTSSITIELWIGKNSMVVNGEVLTLPQAPVLSSPPLPAELAGNTYMPIREVAEALYVTVGWVGDERKVTLDQNINGKTKSIELWIGKTQAKVDGETVWIDDSHKLYPAIVNSKTMLPLRFVTESLGANVDWIAAEKKIVLTFTP